MTYDEIDETTEVTQGEAIAELEKHFTNVEVLMFGELYSVEEDDIIAFPLENGMYSAQEILTWLGY